MSADLDEKFDYTDSLIAGLKNADVEDALPKVVRINTPPMHDELEAPYEVQSEKPWHRVLAYMLIKGATVKDAAQELGKSVDHCRAVKKQPWFKQLTAELCKQHFNDDVTRLLEGAAVESIMTLTDLASSAESEPVRRSAASDLLNQYLRNKPVESEDPIEDPQAELDKLNRELEHLRDNSTE
jgi:hypothetical protein